MAQDILTIFVYIFGLTLIVAGINLAVALAQFIEDIPSIRKMIWTWQNRRLNRV